MQNRRATDLPPAPVGPSSPGSRASITDARLHWGFYFCSHGPSRSRSYVKVSVLLVGNTADFILGGTQRFKSHTHARTHARTHTHAQTHKRTHTHARVCTQTHARTHTHTHTHTQACAPFHPRTFSHAHTNTHAITRTHTQTHTHTKRNLFGAIINTASKV